MTETGMFESKGQIRAFPAGCDQDKWRKERKLRGTTQCAFTFLRKSDQTGENLYAFLA